MVQKIRLDKSSPYKNGGFLPLFNTVFLNHAYFSITKDA